MAELFDLREIEERVVLAAVSTQEGEAAASSLDELEELARTAGAVCVAKVVQNRESIHPGTYLGKGKLDEGKELVWELGATGVICDDELSPAQLKNLEERAARLVGMRASLSRLGGGIGTRGPGEKKLEMDRRLIHQRIGQLKGELEDVKRHREVTRQQREKNYTMTAAIVGYTNAGKSTLLNRLTGAGILAEDKLFATLDPTTRSYTLTNGQQILLTDTVGFIRKLPHHLIEAFRSTLEEARYSDIILHVVDCSNPQMDMQMHVVRETLRELQIVDKTTVTVFNKIDRVREMAAAKGISESAMVPRDFDADYQVKISARTGEGLKELGEILENIIRARRVFLKKTYPYAQAGRIQTIRKYGQLLKEEYGEDGIRVEAYVPAELFGELWKS